MPARPGQPPKGARAVTPSRSDTRCGRRRLAWWQSAALVLSQLSTACGDEPAGSGGGTDSETANETLDSTTDDGAGWRRICDGSQELKLAVRTGGFEGGSTYLANELGRSYLYVRGDCTYWVATVSQPKNPDGFTLSAWQVTHAGTLTPAAEQELSQELLYDRWPELAGHYRFPTNPGGLVIEYSDGEATIVCDLACSQEVDAPQELKDLTAVANTWMDRLWDLGEGVAAGEPLRVDVLRTSFDGAPPLTDDPCARVWEFDLDPAAVARGPDDAPASHLVSDAAVVSEMRALRDDYLAGLPEPACNYVFQDGALLLYQAAAPMVALSLWMRDGVPFETVDGRIALPPPPKSP